MSLKSKIKFTLVLTCVLAVLLLTLLTVFFLYLPNFLESKIIPQLAKASGISDLKVNARSIGFLGADLGRVQLGPEKKPALIVQSVQIDYSPAELYQKKINRVIASGIELYCQFKNGEFGMRGFDLKKQLTQWRSGREKDTDPKDDAPRIFVESVALRNGIVIIDINGDIFRVPFEIDVSTRDRTFENLTFNILTHFRSQEINIRGDLTLPEKQISLRLSAPALNLARFADITELIEDLIVTGAADVTGEAVLQLAPFKISTVNALLTLKRSDIKYKNLHFRNVRDPQNGTIPISCEIEGIDGKKWQLKASNITTVSPVPIRLNHISGTIEKIENKIKGSGDLMISMAPSKKTDAMALPIRVMTPLHFPAYFSAELSDKQAWQINVGSKPIKTAPPNVVRLKFAPFEITSKFPLISVTGTGNRDKIAATYMVKLANVQAQNKDVNLFLPKIVLKGKADFDLERAAQKIVFELKSPAVKMKRKPMEIKFDKAFVSGSAGRNGMGSIRIDGEAQLAGIGVNSPNYNFQCKGVRIKLPLQWPVEKSSKKGSIAIAAMHYGKFKLGAVRAALNQTASGISFNGRINSDLVPELSAKFSGNSNLFNSDNYATKAHFEISLSEAAPEISLGRFLPAAKGFTFQGGFFEEGDLVIGKDGISGTVTSVLSNGRLVHRQNKIEIEGIETTLVVAALPNIRSKPGQQLKFSKATFGGLNILDGQIDFQIESSKALLIEKSHFRWCDGNVDAPAIRLISGVEDYNLILYCIGLNLAKVLEEFGVASVEAQGNLDGRIALRYKNGLLSFDDGFLYSIPDEPARIRMLDTEILTAGIPPDSPQYMQIELARKALEDYKYDWASLNITTDGEDLLLQMKLDGKPANKLPFVYRKDIGSFAKVEAGVEGSDFEGIRLDVNFRLPMNKIMQYKDLIRMIQLEKE